MGMSLGSRYVSHVSRIIDDLPSFFHHNHPVEVLARPYSLHDEEGVAPSLQLWGVEEVPLDEIL